MTAPLSPAYTITPAQHETVATLRARLTAGIEANCFPPERAKTLLTKLDREVAKESRLGLHLFLADYGAALEAECRSMERASAVQKQRIAA